ncbi:GerW family sporulation protein [Sporomusa acidovorans]|uniref:Spore protein YtfJ n=1 Tax=Sporomusa acidovorans (strain ATCC 49682 / DSM 3132 / Mol) TaxID=1123286 RepID=A0ABZ3J3Y7_SPOA4|nr:GerW family sporulation protein [Sporomusa acidovorans]OZC20323.1 putative spore protein YtfJ [Sporomusa acidovorans DSM 3132]SDD37692.1 sporulation protein YtfJ [Sporomusa acidovorans]
MAEHPIQGLMKTAMESIKGMVDVNTIVGDAVETPDGTVIVPISRVAFGFAAGGGDYEAENTEKEHPFGGASGAGISVKPVGFLVCSPSSGVRFMSVESNLFYDRLIDMVPQVMNKIENMLGKSNDEDTDLEELAQTAETQPIHQHSTL